MDIIKLKQQLAEAENAYHSLQTGTMARVVVDQNGERVEFTAASRQDLAAYIRSLQSSIGTAACFPTLQLGPASFSF